MDSAATYEKIAQLLHEVDDKLKSAASLTVTGGKELKITFTMNAKVLPRTLFMWFAAESKVERVEPGVKK